MPTRQGPIDKCYWKKFRKNGKWHPVLCAHAFSEVARLLGQSERALEKKDREIIRLKRKIEELKHMIPQRHWRD